MATQYIYVQPVGKFEVDVLDKIMEALEHRFGLPTKLRPMIDVPQETYDKKRGQYHSTPILDKLRVNIPQDAARVLGVTDVDLFVPELNFVFGEADPTSGVALISLARLKDPNEAKYFARAIKEAVHELGHTIGLKHCKSPKCVMYFSNSLMDTDRKGADFCENCKRTAKIRKV